MRLCCDGIAIVFSRGFPHGLLLCSANRLLTTEGYDFPFDPPLKLDLSCLLSIPFLTPSIIKFIELLHLEAIEGMKFQFARTRRATTTCTSTNLNKLKNNFVE
jgi:hypothetical protein